MSLRQSFRIRNSGARPYPLASTWSILALNRTRIIVAEIWNKNRRLPINPLLTRGFMAIMFSPVMLSLTAFLATIVLFIPELFNSLEIYHARDEGAALYRNSSVLMIRTVISLPTSCFSCTIQYTFSALPQNQPLAASQALSLLYRQRQLPLYLWNQEVSTFVDDIHEKPPSEAFPKIAI